MPLPDLKKSSLGTRLRYLRKRRGLTRFDLARLTGVSHNTIARMERGDVEPEPARLGRLLAYFGEDARLVLDEGADIYDAAIPPADFGSWLRNFRMRRGLRQNDLAKALGVSKVTVCRYEKQGFRPDREVLARLRRRFKLNGEIERFFE